MGLGGWACQRIRHVPDCAPGWVDNAQFFTSHAIFAWVTPAILLDTASFTEDATMPRTAPEPMEDMAALNSEDMVEG